MYATIGTIQGNTVFTNDCSLERFSGRKVIITVLEEENQFSTVSDDKLFVLSDSLISQNMEAYKELANLSRLCKICCYARGLRQFLLSEIRFAE